MLRRWWWAVLLLLSVSGCTARAQAAGCTVAPASFQGWQAQELRNEHVSLVLVPQLGGRLMQVTFDGHPYLFVNPAYRGKYIPPAKAHGGWINYGGDKVWPMPEGTGDEHHWVLASTAIDDLPAKFEVLQQGSRCAVRLTGVADTITGMQLIRTVEMDADSPEIRFAASMRNATLHPIQWSIQSVTQYDLADSHDAATWNRKFWAFTPLNPQSAYPDGFHVRSGLADDPAFQTSDGMFRLHWGYFSNEVWLDSTAGWLAVVDAAAEFGMVEQFHVDPHGEYPGKATTIFYKNGPSVSFDEAGVASIGKHSAATAPFYMEAEINSPVVALQPGESYTFHTAWHPLHIRGAPLLVADAGVVTRALTVLTHNGEWRLEAEYTPFHSGSLQATVYSRAGQVLRTETIGTAEGGGDVRVSARMPLVPDAARLVVKVRSDAGEDLVTLDHLELSKADAGGELSGVGP